MPVRFCAEPTFVAVLGEPNGTPPLSSVVIVVVVVVYWIFLPALLVPFWQVIVWPPPEEALQESTSTNPVSVVWQVTVGPLPGLDAEHDDAFTKPVSEATEQVVAVKLLPAAAATAVQVPISVGPVESGLQVVVTQLFPGAPADAVQLNTGMLVVEVTEQVIVVKLLPAAAVCAEQDGTPVAA